MIESEFQEILPDNLSITTPGSTAQFRKDTEFWEFLLMIGFGNTSFSKELFHKLRQQIVRDDWRRPLLELGEARLLSLMGREFESLMRLEAASSLMFSESDFSNEAIHFELVALYNYVSFSINGKLNHNQHNLSLLFGGKDLTANTNFKLAFNLQIARIQVSRHGYPLSLLLSVVKQFEQHNLNILACIGYRAAGIHARRSQKYALAFDLYESAMSHARKFDLKINIKQILVSQAYTYFMQDRIHLAEKTFSKIIPEDALDPILPIVYENFSLITTKRGEHDLSVEWVKKALAISTQLDSISRIPAQCLYLGDIHRTHYQDLGQAEYYYKLGHDHSMRYAEQGICLIGDRRKVVDAYHKLLHDSKPAPVTAKSSMNIDVFAFAGGKPWKEIKDTFQHQLILYHAANELNSRQLAKKLALPASTLYSIRERLKVRGYLLPGKDQSPPSETHDLQGFIHQHGELNWDEINELFEREMIHYLYEKYGYNKNRMANILDLSYPSIISKTRELTRIDGHFLPN